MGKAPAFQFYAADFVIGCLGLSLEEIGAYAKLLALSWDKGPVPLEDARRASWLGVSAKDAKRIWLVIGEKWTETPEGFVNERLEEQRAERAAFVAKQAENGRRSGHARRTKREPNVNGGSATVTPNVPTKPQPNTNSSVFDLQTSDHDPNTDHSDRVSDTPPVWRSGPRRSRPEDRDLDYHRRNCPLVWGSSACDAGICIPAYLWPKWEKRQATTALRPFVDEWTPRIAGGERPEDFWPRAFAEHFGTPADKPRDKTTQAISAAQGALAILRSERKALPHG